MAGGYRLGEQGLIDRRQTLIDPPDLFRVDVHPENIKSAFGEGGGNAGPEFSQAADGNHLDEVVTLE